MKRGIVLMLVGLLLGVGSLSAQYIVVGGYVTLPSQGVRWLSDRPDLKGKALLVEFFHSANAQCRERVEEVNRLAHTYNNILNVAVVAREPVEQVADILLHQYQYAYIALDEQGTLFAQYEVPHVPYALLLSERGEVLWFGNPTHLNAETIEQLLD